MRDRVVAKTSHEEYIRCHPPQVLMPKINTNGDACGNPSCAREGGLLRDSGGDAYFNTATKL